MRRPAAALVVLLALAGAGCVVWRASWHGWPWQQPEWVHWCGRDYEAGRRVAVGGPLHPAGRYPPVVGRRLFSTLDAAAREARRRRGDVCDMHVYLAAGDGEPRAYVLLGGP